MNFSRKEQYIIAGLLAFLILLGGLIIYNSGTAKEVDAIVTEEQNKQSVESTELIIHVCGEVQKPGVYKLLMGKRVIDAVEAAGGATTQGDLDKLNLATPLEDGQKIYLPAFANSNSYQPPTKTRHVQQKFVDNNSPLINLNLANQQELEFLPGIGPALAKRIVDYRSQQGSFASVEDLRKISGIGEKKFEQLKDLVTVN